MSLASDNSVNSSHLPSEIKMVSMLACVRDTDKVHPEILSQIIGKDVHTGGSIVSLKVPSDKLNSLKTDDNIIGTQHSSALQVARSYQKPIKQRGAFIVFEGIDRSGKSTQTVKLVDFLNGNKTAAKLMRFPNRETESGKVINAYLTNNADVDDKVIHKLFSDNRWEFRKEIYNTLNEGVSLIVDRYAFSGVAFTAAKGIDLDWCKIPDRGLPAPDVVIYLELPVESAEKRGQYGEERYEKVDFQKKVKQIFEEDLKDDTWVALDASKTIEELEKSIQDISLRVIDKVKEDPIKELWK